MTGPEPTPPAAAMPWWRSCLLNMGLIGFSLLLVGVMAEGVIRLIGAARDYQERPEEERIYAYHSVLGYRMKPHLKNAPFHGFDWGVTRFDTNALGWREAPVPRQKPPGEKWVFVLGDSIVAGLEVKARETMTRQLQNRRGREVRVFNAGTRGYSTAQQALLLEKIILPLKPDAVVLVTVFNDPSDNVTGAVAAKPARRPLFRLDQNGGLIPPVLPVKNYPETVNAKLLLAQKLVIEKKSESWLWRKKWQKSFHEIKRRLHLHRFISMRLAGIKDRLTHQKQSDKQPVEEVWRTALEPPKNPEGKAQMALYCSLVKRMEAQLKGRGVPFVVTAYVGLFQLEAQKLDMKNPAPRTMENFTSRQCLTGHGQFVSVLDAFAKAHQHKEKIYWPHDQHYAPKGHALTAEVLTPMVKKSLDRELMYTR